MRRLLTYTSLVATSLLVLLLIPAKILAVDVTPVACFNNNPAQRPSICPDVKNPGNPLLGPSGIITDVVQILTILIGIAAVVTIMIAGLRMIVSSGDPSSVNTARNAIIYAVIGLVIAFASQAIITFVLKRVKV